MEVRQVSSAIMELYLEKRGKIRMGPLKPESFRRKFFYGITYFALHTLLFDGNVKKVNVVQVTKELRMFMHNLVSFAIV